MVSVTVNGIEELEALLNVMPDAMFKNAKKAFSENAIAVQRKVVSRLKRGPMYSRTGALARSIKPKTTGTSIDSLFSSVYTDSIYATIHETGGTITAKKAYANLIGGPYLNIPANANKTNAGVMRENARSVFATGGYIVPINAGKAKYMVARNGIPMFWLVKSVDIPARLDMIKTATDEVPTLISNLNNVLLEGLE